MLTGFVLITEIVEAKWRTPAGVIFQFPFQIGHASLGLFGYLLRDWRQFQIAISAPPLLLLSYYWIMPESPRWLVSVGRTDEAIAILRKGAMINKTPKEVSEEAEKILRSQTPKQEQKGGNILELVRTKKLLIRTLCTCVNWVVIGLCYFGVAQYMGHVGGDIFVNVAISGLIQLPANVCCIFLMDMKILGRKRTQVLFFCVCSLGMLIIPAVDESQRWILGGIGMMSISITFSVVYVWTGELFPTVVRNVAMGTASMFARFGSMTAPFVASLGSNDWVSPVVFGVAPLIASVACIPLRETLGCKLKDNNKDEEVDNRKVMELGDRNGEEKIERF